MLSGYPDIISLYPGPTFYLKSKFHWPRVRLQINPNVDPSPYILQAGMLDVKARFLPLLTYPCLPFNYLTAE